MICKFVSKHCGESESEVGTIVALHRGKRASDGEERSIARAPERREGGGVAGSLA